MTPSLANSPKSLFAASQYAAWASSRVLYVPKDSLLPSIPIRACHPDPLRFTPLYPLILEELTRLFRMFCDFVAGLKFPLLLSNRFPFLWSVSRFSTPIKNLWRHVSFPFTRALAYQLPLVLCVDHVCFPTISISSASIVAQNPFVNSKRAIEGPITCTGDLDDERL